MLERESDWRRSIQVRGDAHQGRQWGRTLHFATSISTRSEAVHSQSRGLGYYSRQSQLQRKHVAEEALEVANPDPAIAMPYSAQPKDDSMPAVLDELWEVDYVDEGCVESVGERSATHLLAISKHSPML